jgi:predicted ferric reductase
MGSDLTVPTARVAGRRLPRVWPLRPTDILFVLVANALLITGMWIRHGGLDTMGNVGGMATGAGQLTALLGTYLALVQLVLMSRSPWLDHVVGTDRLLGWHRWAGFACLWLLVGHAVFTTIGWAAADGISLLDETTTLLGRTEWVLMATVGLALFVLVAVTSVRAARRRLSYETWYGLHLYAYLAIALAFIHELTLGTDFIGDKVAVAYWVALYVVTIALVLTFRFGAPIRLSLRHRLRVASVVQEAPGVVSIYLTGRHLDRLAVDSGQFFHWRFLIGGGWWRPHPFSLSAVPNGACLRITVKNLGDDSGWLLALKPGVRVMFEGPYGIFTPSRMSRLAALFIAGGIGITPLRAMLEDLPPGPNAITLLYRARSWDEVVFRSELDSLAASRGARIIYLVGRRGSREMPNDPLTPAAIAWLVPDLHDRDIFLCGPDGFLSHVQRSLRSLRVPKEHIHAERFAF